MAAKQNKPNNVKAAVFDLDDVVNQEGFDFKNFLESNNFKEFSKIEKAFDEDVISLSDILDCSESELHEMLSEHEISVIQRKRFIKAIQKIPRSKLNPQNCTTTSIICHNINPAAPSSHVSAQNTEETKENTISINEALPIELQPQLNESEPSLDASSATHFSKLSAHEQKEWLARKLYPQIAILAPEYASKITGMLSQFDTQELISIMKDHNQLQAKVAEAQRMLQNCQKKAFASLAASVISDMPLANENSSGDSSEKKAFESVENSIADPSNCNSLYVGGLDKNVTEADLFNVFNQFADVESLRVCRDIKTRVSLGYAFVKFWSVKTAMDAINNNKNKCNDLKIKGKSCFVRWVADHCDSIKNTRTTFATIENKNKNENKSDKNNYFDASEPEVELKVEEIEKEKEKETKEVYYKSKSLYVADLDKSVSEADLFAIFNKPAHVLSLRVCRDIRTQQSLGYAYVNYASVTEAETAMNKVNFTPIKGKECRVTWKQSNFAQKCKNTVEYHKCSVWVKNLNKYIDNKQLFDIFNKYGTILSHKVAKNKESGKSLKYGYVCYTNQSSAERAIQEANGMDINGVQMVVTAYNPKHKELDVGDDDVKNEQQNQKTNVYVSHIPWECSEKDCKETFEKLVNECLNISDCEITNCKMWINAKNTAGCFNFKTCAQAAAAVKVLNGYNFNSIATKKFGAPSRLFATFAEKRKTREYLLGKQQHDKMIHRKQNRRNGLCSVFVRNLGQDVDNMELREMFQESGKVESVKVLKDAMGLSKRCGFVNFATQEAATQALHDMNGKNQRKGQKPLSVTRYKVSK